MILYHEGFAYMKVVTYLNQQIDPIAMPNAAFAFYDAVLLTIQIHVERSVEAVDEKQCYDVTKPESFGFAGVW